MVAWNKVRLNRNRFYNLWEGKQFKILAFHVSDFSYFQLFISPYTYTNFVFQQSGQSSSSICISDMKTYIQLMSSFWVFFNYLIKYRNVIFSPINKFTFLKQPLIWMARATDLIFRSKSIKFCLFYKLQCP